MKRLVVDRAYIDDQEQPKSEIELSVTIRRSQVKDTKRLLQIYSPYVEETHISFELEVPTLNEFQKRLETQTDRHFWLVLESNGELMGYAYSSAFRLRAAYTQTVETSVYLDLKFHGSGYGQMLYRQLLIELKRTRSVKTVIGGIALPNEKSVRLHEKMGFVKVAHFKEIGFKFGKYWDAGFWQYIFE